MSMGTNVIIEDLIELGACEGVDRKNCVKALTKVLNMKSGSRGFAERIMGSEFDVWREQTRRAFKIFTAAAGQPMEDNGDEDDHYGDVETGVE